MPTRDESSQNQDSRDKADDGRRDDSIVVNMGSLVCFEVIRITIHYHKYDRVYTFDTNSD